MQNPPPPNQGGYGYGNQYGAPPPPPPSGMPPGGGGKTSLGGLDENLAAMLCYLTMFCCGLGIIVSLVFFITEKVSRLVRFHAMQALLFGGFWIVLGIVFRILYTLLAVADMAILSLGLLLIQLLCLLILIVGLVFAAIQAYQSKMFKLPIIGNIAENIAK